MLSMGYRRQHDSPRDSGKSVASVMDHSGDSVTPVGGTEPDHARRPDPASGAAEAGDNWPSEPDEHWFDDPDAHLDEIVDYMKRLHARCASSDEFVAALKGLFPDLEEKVSRGRAMDQEDLGDYHMPDPDADIAAGRSIIYLSGAELLAADMADEFEPRCA